MKHARASIPSLSDFIRKEGDDIILREDLSMVIDAFGSRIAKSLRMSFLQGFSAQAKIESGLKGALAQDIVENKIPLLNLAGDVLGFNTKQYIAKHPDALGQLLQLAGPYLKGLNIPNISGNATQSQGNNGDPFG